MEYDWKKFFDGRVHKLTRGVDFDGTKTSSVRIALINGARTWGERLATEVVKEKIQKQHTDESGKVTVGEVWTESIYFTVGGLPGLYERQAEEDEKRNLRKEAVDDIIVQAKGDEIRVSRQLHGDDTLGWYQSKEYLNKRYQVFLTIGLSHRAAIRTLIAEGAEHEAIRKHIDANWPGQYIPEEGQDGEG